MRFELRPHPNHPSRQVDGVSIELRRSGAHFTLTYETEGGEKIIWPEPMPPARMDGLWRTTCFELFLLFDDDERYVEFNFSPSSRWAAYAFDGYREGMTSLAIAPPVIRRLPAGVEVGCDLSGLPHGEHRMALAAVIEEQDGTKSYWALAHAPGPPDFHNPACFTATLPSPPRA